MPKRSDLQWVGGTMPLDNAFETFGKFQDVWEVILEVSIPFLRVFFCNEYPSTIYRVICRRKSSGSKSPLQNKCRCYDAYDAQVRCRIGRLREYAGVLVNSLKDCWHL